MRGVDVSRRMTASALYVLLPLAAFGLAGCAEQSVVPPTANHEHPGDECDLDYVPLKPRKMNINKALINIHGLGNGNSTMIISKVA